MRRAAEHSAGAYLASVMRAAEVDGWPAHLATGFAQALDALCAGSGLDPAAVRDPAQLRTQRCFSEAVDKRAFASLLAAAPRLDQARLLSVSARRSKRRSWASVTGSDSTRRRERAFLCSPY